MLYLSVDFLSMIRTGLTTILKVESFSFLMSLCINLPASYPPFSTSSIIEENFAIIRKKVAKLEDDRLIGEDILTMVEMVRNREFIVQL